MLRMTAAPIPLTVIGGYLGAGKTTLVNQLLCHPGGRRLGVIVNDFGSLAVDAELLSDAAGPGGVVSLPNGCVCCTVGAGLHEALGQLVGRADPPDHIVIEVSGVADPAAAGAWGTVPPFEPGGVVVLAAADAVRQQARDRYVGTDVVRQLAGADLVLVTKTDLVSPESLSGLHGWLDDRSHGAPRLDVVAGDLPADVALGVHPSGGPLPSGDGEAHDGRYRSWVWTSQEPIERADLDAVVDGLGPVLRAKGVVRLTDGSSVLVQVVGRRREFSPISVGEPLAGASQLVAIAIAPDPDPPPFA